MFPSYKRQAHAIDIILPDIIMYTSWNNTYLAPYPRFAAINRKDVWKVAYCNPSRCPFLPVFPCPSPRIVDNGASLDRILFSQSQTDSAGSQEGRRLATAKTFASPKQWHGTWKKHPPKCTKLVLQSAFFKGYVSFWQCVSFYLLMLRILIL